MVLGGVGAYWAIWWRHPPLLQEGAAGVFNALQLQEAGAHQQGLDVLLVDGNMAAVGKVDQSLQGTVRRTGTG